MNEQVIREQIIEYGKKLVENKLIQATWGNISVCLDDSYFLITPTGVDYYKLKPEDIVKVSLVDYSYQGNIKPSSEKVLHGMIYQKIGCQKAIIHIHSSSLQSFAACHKDLLKDNEIMYPCSKYAVSGSKKLAKNVSSILGNYHGVIMANHGFISWDLDLEKTLQRCLDAEKLAFEILEDNR